MNAVTKRQTNEARLRSQIERYEAFFAELESFIRFVRDDRVELEKAVGKMAKAKDAYEAARDEVKQLRDSITSAKDALFRLVEPGVDEFLPLFDRMEPADPDKHGEGSDQWRKDPISALRLSPQLFLLATNLINRLDSALISRIDLKLEFGPPTEQQALDVLAYWSETLHEYGADDWAPQIRRGIESNRDFPQSFRDLWQAITCAVRQHVCSAAV